MRQRAVFGTKCGRDRATLNTQKGYQINGLAFYSLLATDQKVRSSNLFGRAIFLSLSLSSWPTFYGCSAVMHREDEQGESVARASRTRERRYRRDRGKAPDNRPPRPAVLLLVPGLDATPAKDGTSRF